MRTARVHTIPMTAQADDDLDMLWEVVREGDRATIEALLIGDDEHPPLGCSVDVHDPAGMTPLHWLSIEAHSDVVEWRGRSE